jgi:hypothetical protein
MSINFEQDWVVRWLAEASKALADDQKANWVLSLVFQPEHRGNGFNSVQLRENARSSAALRLIRVNSERAAAEFREEMNFPDREHGL